MVLEYIAGRLFYGGNLDTCFPTVNGRVNLSFNRSRDGFEALNVIANISNVNVSVSNYKENIQHLIFHPTHSKCAFAKTIASFLYAIPLR